MSSSLSNQEIADRVLLLLREVIPEFAREEVRPEMSLQNDLGIDSLGRAGFEFLMEQEFGLNFADLGPRGSEVRTVAHVLDVAIRNITANGKSGTPVN